METTNRKEFSSFEANLIVIIFLLAPLLIFNTGVILLVQEDFSNEAIIGSIFIFALSIAGFFALGLHNIFKNDKSKGGK